ncbi:MAG: hypothetical protein RIT26_532 [Pseudomonadota bacterium]
MNKTLALALAALPWVWACSPSAPPPEPVRSVKLVTAQSTDGASAAGWAAEVRARYETRLSFRIGGLLTQRSIELGQRFKAGQLLAQLDPQDAGLNSQAAQAQLLNARIQRDLAATELQRFEVLWKQGFIGPAEWDRRQAGWRSAQAQFEQAQAQADLLLNQASYAQLIAPQAGVVTGLEAEPGQVLTAGAPVLRVAWDGPREVQAWVSEDQVASWKVGQTVQVTRWGETERVSARLREVSASADPQTRSYLVRIDLPANQDWALGQTARVWRGESNSSTASGVALPTSAVLQVKGQASVWVYDPVQQQVQPVAVQVQGYQGDRVLVSSGLSAGQQVVAAGGHALTPGQKVTPYVGKNPVPDPADAQATPGTRP